MLPEAVNGDDQAVLESGRGLSMTEEAVSAGDGMEGDCCSRLCVVVLFLRPKKERKALLGDGERGDAAMVRLSVCTPRPFKAATCFLLLRVTLTLKSEFGDTSIPISCNLRIPMVSWA